MISVYVCEDDTRLTVKGETMMTSATRRSICAAVTVLVVGCVPDDPDVHATREAIDEIWAQYSATLDAGDLDGWLALWTEDGIQMPFQEPAAVGIESIRKRMSATLDAFHLSEMSINMQEVGVGGDWAFSRGVYTVNMVPSQGGDAALFNGKFMTILKRQPDGSWKIHRDIFSSNEPLS